MPIHRALWFYSLVWPPYLLFYTKRTCMGVTSLILLGWHHTTTESDLLRPIYTPLSKSLKKKKWELLSMRDFLVSLLVLNSFHGYLSRQWHQFAGQGSREFFYILFTVPVILSLVVITNRIKTLAFKLICASAKYSQ